MNRTSKFAHIIFSALITLTVIMSAVQPVTAKSSGTSLPVGLDATASLAKLDSASQTNIEAEAGYTPQLTGTWPVYFEIVIDESRGWIYGSDSAGAKIDVIRMSDLQLEKSILLPGTNPKGIALSPDGSELTVANYGIGGMFDTAIGSIIFINPDTNAVVASLIPDVPSSPSNRPWDIVYGDPNRQRLYSIGNPNSAGFDFIHAIDTSTHTEVGKSTYATGYVRMCPAMTISSDKNSLYVFQSCQSPINISKYDLTTDTPTQVDSAPFGSSLTGKNIVLSADDSKIFVDSGQVWSAGLIGRIGSTGQAGNIALLTAHNAIAVTVDNASGNDAISFYSVNDYYGITTYALPTQGALGAISVLSDESKIFVSSSDGIISIPLNLGLPGNPIPLPSGSLPYFDLVADDARGWLYGSDSTGHKIDVISMDTQAVIKQYRLVNGATPKGIALSPDGSELAVAEYGASSIVFLDPQTGQTVASLMPNNENEFNNGLNLPWDLVYGRVGRLYSVGNPESAGSEYVHIIDTSTHSEVGRDRLGGRISLQISPDKNTLYYLDSNSTTPGINSIDVSTDVLPEPLYSYSAEPIGTRYFVLSESGDKIFVDSGNVRSKDLSGPIGSFGEAGSIALLPSRNAVAIAIDNAGNDAISFYDTDDYYGITTYSLPALGVIGPMVANANGTKLYMSSSSGVTFINLTSGFPGTPIPLPVGSLPYYDLVADEPRGWLYGSDPAGHKIDVISMSNMAVVKSYRLVNGASPTAIALSPDGTELAVAEFGASSIVFLNPQTGQNIATLIPNAGTNFPWDLAYGRAGRLYSVGNPNSYGIDYIHVIDTVTHTEVGISHYPNVIDMCPALVISPDHNELYAYQTCQSPRKITKFDVTTDTPTPIVSSPHASWLYADDLVVSSDGTKLFTNSGQVVDGSLKGQIGSTGQEGSIALLPAYNAIAVTVDNSGNDAVSFYDASTYYGIKTYALPALGSLGPIVALPSGGKLFLSSSNGVVSIDTALGLPGVAIPLPSGNQPYFDLVLDEARDVIYGSDPIGHKIDVISLSTLQVIKQFRLVNGSYPVGIDLSPDGEELAVAENGASSIVFLDPDTGTMIASIIPNIAVAANLNLPWDVIYGRAGRLYSTGTPTSYGLDYVHVFDTVTHTEISRSGIVNVFIRSHPTLAISADFNTLYVDESHPSSHMVRMIDVSTDSLEDPTKTITLGYTSQKATILLLLDQSKLLTSAGQVVDANLQTLLGTFTPSGRLAEIPSQNAFLSTSGNQITFFDSSTYQQVGYTILNGVTSTGAVVVKSDDSALYVTTNDGIRTFDLSVFPPPPPIPPAAFVKTAPSNGAINQSVKPTFSWQSSSDVSYYEYCYDSTNDNACASWVNNGLATSVTLSSSLTPNTTYYWQVRAINPAGTTYANGSLAAFWSIKTAVFPGTFTKSSPANNSTKQPTTLTLKWNISSGATFYEYCYDSTNNGVCDNNWITAIGTSATITGLTNNLTYYWQARAGTPAGFAYADSGWWSFTVVMPPPESTQPGNVYPGGPADNVHTRRPTFDWDPVPGATGYTIEIVAFNYCGTFSTKFLSASVTTNSYTATKDLAAGATYCWRVRANGTNGPSAYSQVRTFTTGNPPTIPALKTPANNVLLPTTTPPPFDWADSTLPSGTTTTFDHYEFQIDTTNTFAVASTFTTTLSALTPPMPLEFPALNPATTYYWRVRAWNTAGDYSGWSAPFSFRIAYQAPLSVSPGDLYPTTPPAVNIHTRRPEFTWGVVPGATGYTVEIVAANYCTSFSTKFLTASVTTNSYTATKDLAAGAVYCWRVRATGTYGPSAYSQVRTFTTGNPPSVPKLSAPANNALLTTTAQPLFEWANATLPTGTNFNYYEYQIDTTSAFTTATTFKTAIGDINDSDLTPPTVGFPVLNRATTYYWRVRAWNTAGDYSGWSAPFSFRIAYEAPTLLSPLNSTTLTTLKPTFTWTAVLGATSYKIQVSTSITFGTTVVNVTVSSPSYVRTTSLTAKKTYYWRVQALGPYGPSAWSAIWTFITP